MYIVVIYHLCSFYQLGMYIVNKYRVLYLLILKKIDVCKIQIYILIIIK